jgi:hypothetical protein
MMSKIQIQVGFLKFTHEAATARVTLWDDNIAYISGVYSRIRGAGQASQVLRDICEFGDDNQMVLQLDVSSYGYDNHLKLTDEQLLEWYGKFGFKIVPDGGFPILMERLPNSQELQPV